MFDLSLFDMSAELEADFETGNATDTVLESTLFSDLAKISDFNSEGNSWNEGESIGSFEIQDFDSWHSEVFGEPIKDSLVWHQQSTDFTCGVVSSEMILKMFGLDISEAELVYEATQEGLLTDSGITTDGIQKLLQNHGLNTHLSNGDISDLQNELEANHKIVIPLDSGEIWGEDSVFEDLIGERADHAVVLTGIDSKNEVVFLNDPGHPDGQAMEVNLDLFVDAWNDSGNQFIATNDEPFVI